MARIHSEGIPALLTPEQWAYIAGIFDGEGNLENRSRTSPQYAVTIGQLVETGLCPWLQQTLQCGKVQAVKSYSKRSRPFEMYRLMGARRIWDFLTGVTPYLIVKSNVTDAALHHLSDRHGW